MDNQSNGAFFQSMYREATENIRSLQPLLKQVVESTSCVDRAGITDALETVKGCDWMGLSSVTEVMKAHEDTWREQMASLLSSWKLVSDVPLARMAQQLRETAFNFPTQALLNDFLTSLTKYDVQGILARYDVQGVLDDYFAGLGRYMTADIAGVSYQPDFSVIDVPEGPTPVRTVLNPARKAVLVGLLAALLVTTGKVSARDAIALLTLIVAFLQLLAMSNQD